MRRVDNWESKLDNFIEARRNIGMEWGTSDCFLLVFDMAQVITGLEHDDVNPDKPFRGKYRTPRQGYNLLKKYSGGGLAETCDMIAKQLGMIEKQVRFASRGDVAMLHVETLIGGVRDVMGIVMGDVVVAQGKDGLLFIDRKEIKRAWSL